MTLVARLLGYLSLVVNLLLSLALLGVGLLAAFETSDLKLDPIPDWAGTVTRTVLYGGLLGLIAIVLALRSSKVARVPHVLWSLLAASIGAGAFWSPTYRFDGVEDFRLSLLIFAGYLLVVLGSVLHVKGAGPKRRAYRTG
jgi:hypothetical protein